MSHDDPFGAPLNPPGFELSAPGYEALASGDESVLAASGLNSRPSGPRKRKAAIALGLALLVGGAGVALAAGFFRDKDADPAAIAAQPPPSLPPNLNLPSTSPPPTPTPTPKPKPKPAAPKPLVGTAKSITKINSGTLGPAYAVTVPKGWTVGTGVDKNRASNLDVRMRSADKTQSFVIATIKPAIATGRLTPASLAAIKAALLQDASAKALPGTPKARIAGVAATGYDASLTSGGKGVTTRTLVWQRGATIYAATWRVPSASFAKSLPTLNSIIAAVRFPA